MDGEQVCAVGSAGVSVNFRSDVELCSRFRPDGYACFIPDLQAFHHLLDTECEVVYRNSPACSVRFEAERVDVRFPWSQMRNGETVLYLGYPLLERQHQRRSSLTAHAACVSKGGEAVLLLGKEGAGKTSVAIQLCRAHGASLIGNDLCVLGGPDRLVALGGTKFFYLRRESVRRNLPDLLPRFEGVDKDSWLHKVKVTASDLGVSTEADPVAIKRAFLVHVDESQPRLFTARENGLATCLYLNENFSRYIRATCVTMLGGDNYSMLGYIPSLDCEEFFAMRRTMIDTVLGTAELTYVSGPLSLVAKCIATYLS